MAHVFISYAHEDGDFGDILINKLKEAGVTHWVDSEHLRAGEDWRQAIDDAIKDSFALIVVMSPAAKASEYVTYEWAFAWGLGIRVIPLLYKQTNIHPRLEALQYLDFSIRSGRPWDNLIKQLEELKISFKPRLVEQIPVSANVQLVDDLSDPEPDMRKKAARTLGNMQEDSGVPALIHTLEHDTTWSVRKEAAIALGKIGDTSAGKPLIRALARDKNAPVREAIAWSLGELRIREAVPTLVDFIERWKLRGVFIQYNAAIALGKIGERSVVPKLLNALPHKDNRIRAGIIIALGELKDERAIPELTTCLQEESVARFDDKQLSIYELAREALQSIGTQEALNAINAWDRG